MEYLLEGINQGNLTITCVVMLILVIASTKARFLDGGGVAAAVFVGLLVGVLGHWTWLLILLAFLVFFCIHLFALCTPPPSPLLPVLSAHQVSSQ